MHANDPWTRLGVEPGASDDEIRAAYRQQLKLHPPEQDPVGFARIQEAFALIRDPRARAHERLFGPKPFADFDEVRATLVGWRRPAAGAEAWLDVIKEQG